MPPDTKQPSDTPRITIPKHVIDRIENEWQQMRTNASPPPTSSPLQDDRR